MLEDDNLKQNNTRGRDRGTHEFCARVTRARLF